MAGLSSTLSDASTFWHQYFFKFFFMSIPNLTGILTEIQIFYISFCHPGKALWGKKCSSLWIGALVWSRPGVSRFWHTGQNLSVYIFVGTQPHLFVHMLSVCFPAILAELSSCDRDQRAHRAKIFSLCCRTEKVGQTLLL